MTAAAALLAVLSIAPFAAVDAGLATPDSGVLEEPAAAASPTGPPMAVTDDLAAVEIRHLHVVIEREGDRLEVAQIVTVGTSSTVRFSRDGGYPLPLPEGAVAPRGSSQDEGGLRTAVTDSGFAIVDPIPPGGENATVRFSVPLTRGAAAFTQRFASEVGTLQAICTWTDGDAALRVEGAQEAVRAELGNGLVALVVNGRDLDRRLAVSVAGIESGAHLGARRIVLALCVLALVAGIFARFARSRRKPSPTGRAGADDR